MGQQEISCNNQHEYKQSMNHCNEEGRGNRACNVPKTPQVIVTGLSKICNALKDERVLFNIRELLTSAKPNETKS